MKGPDGRSSTTQPLRDGLAAPRVRGLAPPLEGPDCRCGICLHLADLKLYRVVLGAIVSLGSTATAGLVARQGPWRMIFARRLWTYEAPSPRTRLEVLVRNEDSVRAWHVLRRSGFVPLYGALLVVSPSDAPDLNNRIAVQEPEAWLRSTSEEDRIRRIAEVFESAGMRARVSGRDVLPGGRVESRTTEDAQSLAMSLERA